MPIDFRPLTDDDLPMLHRWLNEPGVVRWWEGDDVSWDAVVRDYGSDRGDGTEHYVAVVDGEDVGWIQCYEVGDWPEEAAGWWALGLGPAAGGIDYLVGEPGQRGQGLGSTMIRAFVEEVCFGRHPHWRQVCSDPLSANPASWRALEKAGFRCLGTLESEHGEERLMVVDRPGGPAPG